MFAATIAFASMDDSIPIRKIPGLSNRSIHALLNQNIKTWKDVKELYESRGLRAFSQFPNIGAMSLAEIAEVLIENLPAIPSAVDENVKHPKEPQLKIYETLPEG